MTEEHAQDPFDGIELQTGADPAFAVVWLHGLGADGNDFVPIVPELRLPQATRFVFPHAPIRPITANGGYRMRGWYDILSFEQGAQQDAAGIEASAAIVRGLVAREVARGIATERIVLAGFSQGGAIALYTMLTGPERYAGVVALSTYLPVTGALLRPELRANTTVPVWMAHGNQDPVIDIRMGERSCAALRRLGVSVDWHTYPMPHTVCLDEIRDISAWLTAGQLLADG